MSALQDENQILNYLDLEGKKRAIDEKFFGHEKLRSDSIANGKDVDEEDYATACQELLQKRSDFEAKIKTLLKFGDEGVNLRSLEDSEQRRAEARANAVANKSSKNGTTPQKEPKQGDEQNGCDAHNADWNQIGRAKK